MWGILKLKVGNFETGSKLSPRGPFISYHQLEPDTYQTVLSLSTTIPATYNTTFYKLTL